MGAGGQSRGSSAARPPVDGGDQAVEQGEHLGAARLELGDRRGGEALLHPADAHHHLVEGHLELVAQQVHLLVDLRGLVRRLAVGLGGRGAASTAASGSAAWAISASRSASKSVATSGSGGARLVGVLGGRAVEELLELVGRGRPVMSSMRAIGRPPDPALRRRR